MRIAFISPFLMKAEGSKVFKSKNSVKIRFLDLASKKNPTCYMKYTYTKQLFIIYLQFQCK